MDKPILLFDFGGVLVDLDRERCVRAFADLGFDITPYLGTFAQGGVFSDFEGGKINAHELCNALRQQSGRSDLTDEQLINAWKRYPVIVPADRLALLEKVKQHYRLCVLSNTNPVHWGMTDSELIDYGKKKLKDFFTDTFLSFEMGLQKPDPRIFHEVVRRLGVEAKNILFFDDSAANCEAARRCGMRARLAPAQGAWKTFFDEDGRLRPSCVATVGFFDGVHRGHCHLFRQVAQEAQRRDISSLAITLDRHPAETLANVNAPHLLTPLHQKVRLIQQAGIDKVDVLSFNKETALLTAREFMRHELVERRAVECLVVGYDNHFGSDTQLTIDDYRAIGNKVGLEIIEADELKGNVSSSVVREAICEGNIEEASSLLGHAYTLCGTVVEGHHVGARLGFPTANIAPTDKRQLIPPRGAYAARCQAGGQWYAAMVGITARPTLHNGKDVTIEAHLLDFNGDLYGKELTLEFLCKLRDEVPFKDTNVLRLQLQEDAQAVRQLKLNKP